MDTLLDIIFVNGPLSKVGQFVYIMHSLYSKDVRSFNPKRPGPILMSILSIIWLCVIDKKKETTIFTNILFFSSLFIIAMQKRSARTSCLNLVLASIAFIIYFVMDWNEQFSNFYQLMIATYVFIFLSCCTSWLFSNEVMGLGLSGIDDHDGEPLSSAEAAELMRRR